MNKEDSVISIKFYSMQKQIDKIQQENKQLKEKCEFEIKCNTEFANRIDKAIEYIGDFIFEPLLTNEDRKLIMYNDNLRNFEKILRGDSNE